MKKLVKTLTVILAVMVLAQTGCDYIRSKPGTIADYFPVKHNSYYEYSGKGSEFASQKTYVLYANENRVQRINQAGGYNVTEVLEISDGEMRFIGGHGVFCYNDITGLPPSEQALILKEPLEKGSIWQQDVNTVSEITNMKAKVETDLGKYTAMEITSTVARPATDEREAYTLTTKEYYAKGIGLIKSETYRDDPKSPLITSELVKITENTSVQYYVSLFYPAEDDLKREDHILSVSTNMDFMTWLENEMKNPVEDGLKPLLTPNTKINSLLYDEVNAVIRLDLSKDFIDEMPQEAEEWTIIGIADTLGKLYEVMYLELLIDGGVYDSGRITLETGVYFQVDRIE